MLRGELWAEDTGVRPLHAAPSELERPDSVQRKSKWRWSAATLYFRPEALQEPLLCEKIVMKLNTSEERGAVL
uniref:Uncharacterized protein n=1 Tax=Rangifer tarandus platyrhynchus TaxID=3082113 RepID=A0ACB0EK68_RANTA|nr:unnamed protein product [Rangifer tarandus platyrhynchus]